MTRRPGKPSLLRAWYSTSNPSPAAVAAASRITEEEFRDVYRFARILDSIAQEARDNERARILKMGFWELCREFWKGKKIAKQNHRSSGAEG